MIVRPDILILSRTTDVHALRVLREIERAGVHAHILDLGHPAEDIRVTFFLDAGPTITTKNEPTIVMDAVRAIWYRRPALPSAGESVTNSDERRFIGREWAATIWGLLQNLDAWPMNSPARQETASKPVQLALAKKAGLRVPATLISNDAAEVTSFVHCFNGKVIHKTLTAARHRFHETRLWGETEVAAMGSIAFAPIILQERIVGPADIRVTAVGSQFFAASIMSGTAVDSRLDINVPFETHHLPNHVAAALRTLLTELGLEFATIDLKLTSQNEYVFLEVNPQGQFLYVEILTGLPIAAAVAQLLIERAHN